MNFSTAATAMVSARQIAVRASLSTGASSPALRAPSPPFQMEERNGERRRSGTVGARFWWLFLLLLILGAAPTALAQGLGTVTGVVVSTWDGTPLPGVIVTLRGTTLATQTDASGRFQLANVPSGDQVLRFSKSGFAAAVVSDVRVLTGQSTAVNGNLRPEFFSMEEFEVTAEEFTEQTQEIMFERQQSLTFSDSMGSEFFSKLGASDAAEALGKVTGTTIVDGKYAVIRGLSDRYVSTTLNGAEVPSADPYRKAVQLDIFPSAMIDSIVVNKTFTPDLPGGFTGGAVNVVTKSYPEKFLFNFSLGASYNTQGSLNDNFLSYQGGGTDWLGRDDGTRALPGIVSATPIPTLAQTPPSFDAANAQFREQINQSFGSLQLSPETGSSPLGHNFSLSIGDTTKLFGRRLGYFAGLSYDRDFKSYENAVNNRYRGILPDFSSPDFPPPKILDPEVLLSDSRSVDEVSWGANAALNYELFEGHNFSFTYLLNQVSEDEARVQSGVYDPLNDNREFQTETLHWTERRLEMLQFRGAHQFPDVLDLRLDWLASLAETSQDEPDLRFFSYFRGNSFGQPVFVVDDPLLIRPARYFRELSENNQNFKLDGEVPFNQWSDLVGKLKSGLYYSGSERAYDERTVGYFSHNGYSPFVTNGNSATFLTQSNILAQPAGNGRFTFPRFVYDLQNSFNYDGESTITATYAMMELPLLERLRLVGGARLEKTDLTVETFNAATRTTTTSVIEQTDVLPAASLIYTLATNMNLRLSYAETVARPTFREFAAIDSFDFAGGEILSGNPGLVMSAVKNYDIRWEWFRRAGEVFAVSFFYKDIQNPIEQAQTASGPTRIQYINSAAATLWGIELEARTTLDMLDDNLKDFSVGANFTYIQSEVPRNAIEQANRIVFGVPGDPTRPLYDQSPYIFNADVTYDNRSWGTTVSVVFNISGERLYFAGYTVPDVYAQPAPQLDFILSQRLGERWKLKFSAKNLLNPEVERTYDFDDPTGGQYLYSSYTRGIEFGLSLSFDY